MKKQIVSSPLKIALFTMAFSLAIKGEEKESLNLDSIPMDTVVRVFNELSLSDKGSLAGTSKTFWGLWEKPEIWRSIVNQVHIHIDPKLSMKSQFMNF